MIQFDRVNYRYNEKLETSFVVKEVSFSCRKGVINGIVGANGSGKSTILKLMAGLIHPFSGTVSVEGVDPRLHTIDSGFLTGIIFQNSDNQIVGTTVEEDLAFGLENLGLGPAEMQKRVHATASHFKLEHLLRTPVENLSGGQKQLLCIASVMVMQPLWIVFDEPTSHLDPWARKDFWKIIHELVQEKKIGIVIVSQLPEDLHFFEQIFAFKEGSLVFDGTRDSLRNEPEIKFLNIPESWKFEHLKARLNG